MRPRRFSLFFQIFAWFWATMALLAAALIGIELLTVQQPLVWTQRALIERSLRAEARAGQQILQKSGSKSGKSALIRQLSAFEAQTGVETFWIDARQGRELRGRPVPFGFANLTNLAPDAPVLWRVSGLQVAVLFPVAPDTLFAARFERGAFAVRPATRARRFLAVVTIAGIVCWWLARRFTRPIAALRTATQKLANGDFSARAITEISAKTSRRSDELSLLARDFDAMAAQIETLVGAQKRLVGDVSHELRSPLTRLKIALALARRDAPSSTLLANHLHRIERESGELELLTGELLLLSRLENQLETPCNAVFDWAKTVSQIAEDLRWEAQRADSVEIALQIPEKPVWIEGDEPLLRRALENVTRNALRHAPPQSRIDIELSEQATFCRTTVRDAGIGVPDAELDAIFAPFYRVDTARAREAVSNGTGLGLAIARRAVVAQGGSITARNRVGDGLEIEISLVF